MLVSKTSLEILMSIYVGFKDFFRDYKLPATKQIYLVSAFNDLISTKLVLWDHLRHLISGTATFVQVTFVLVTITITMRGEPGIYFISYFFIFSIFSIKYKNYILKSRIYQKRSTSTPNLQTLLYLSWPMLKINSSYLQRQLKS